MKLTRAMIIVTLILALAVALSGCVTILPGTETPPEAEAPLAPAPEPIPEPGQRTPSSSPSHNFPTVDIVKDSQYWNAAWDATELYQKLWSINKLYRETHTYIEGVFDCNDMTIDLWNILHKQGITSVIAVGNLDLDKERFRECDHTWLLIQHSRDGSLYRCFIIESTNGEVYAFDLKTKALAQYIEGYYYSSPSDFREDTKERW